MKTNYLLARDAVHGAAGKAFITQDGQVKELFGAKKINAQGEIASNDMKVIGTKKIQNKPGGVKLTGTGTVYYGTTMFAEMLAEYIHTGNLPHFNMQVTNDDEATSIGAQTVALYNCQLTGNIPVATLDADADMLTFDFSFTFEDFEILSYYHDPSELGT